MQQNFLARSSFGFSSSHPHFQMMSASTSSRAIKKEKVRLSFKFLGRIQIRELSRNVFRTFQRDPNEVIRFWAKGRRVQRAPRKCHAAPQPPSKPQLSLTIIALH